MGRTPYKMHILDMVTIDTLIFEILEERRGLLTYSPRIVNFLKYLRLDRVKYNLFKLKTGLFKKISFDFCQPLLEKFETLL